MRLLAESIAVTRGGRTVLAGVDFAAAPGEVVGILGPNGAGKTSLLRAFAGFDPQAAERIRFEGRPLAAYPARERARAIAFMPQPAEAAWPVAVEHLVGLGRLPFLHPFGAPDEHDRQAVENALRATELVALRHRAVTTLSAGEASRVFLARALAGEPRLLLADEPTANLDPAHQLAAMTVLRRLAADGATVVMAQHDLALAARFCDRLVLIGAGRIVAEGPPDAVLTPDNLAAVFGIVARYPDDRRDGFFALPWSLVADDNPSDIVPS